MINPTLSCGALICWGVGLSCLSLALAACRVVPATNSKHPPTFRAVTAGNLHNVYVLDAEMRLYSGSSPGAPEDFAALSKLGIKTVVSVDGATPDGDAAAKVRLRYVHVPIGYDGIKSGQALQLAQAANSLPGPIYIHCHHGNHRGPAAAAVAAVSLDGWSPETVRAWLMLAGTSTNYGGLYRDAEGFQPPPKAQLRRSPSSFVAHAPVPSLVESMVAVDHHWDALKAVRAAQYTTPVSQPDLVPVREARLLYELFRESARTDPRSQQNLALREALAQAAEATSALERTLAELTNGSGTRDVAESAFQSVQKSCVTCHRKFRD